MINTLRTLTKIQGVTSDETRVSGYIAEQIIPYVDEVKLDPMGNLIAFKKSKKENAKKLMFCAHMDEIGFIVNYIEDNGYIRVSKVGGINFVAYAFEQVVFANGTRGVIAPEGKTAAADYNADKFFIDIGAKNKKEAEKRVAIGDLCSVVSGITQIRGSRYCGRPLDNRVGCLCVLEIAKRVKDAENDLYFVFSTQEEVGLRGAMAASYNVLPDIGIAFDVTPTGDTIGAPSSVIKLGGGAAIKIKDSSAICDIKLVAALRKLADENKIKYQNEVLDFGGTDTYAMQITGGGARSGCISIPSRYIHSQNEMIDMNDVKEAVALGVAACNIVL